MFRTILVQFRADLVVFTWPVRNRNGALLRLPMWSVCKVVLTLWQTNSSNECMWCAHQCHLNQETKTIPASRFPDWLVGSWLPVWFALPISNRSSSRRRIVWQHCRLSETTSTTSFSCTPLYKYLQIQLAGHCLSPHQNLLVPNTKHYYLDHHALSLISQPQPQLLYSPSRPAPRLQRPVDLVRSPHRQGTRHVRRPADRIPQQRALVQLGPRL